MTIKRMEKITHLDELPVDDFIAFCTNFFNGSPMEISEKMDGQNLSFGIDTNGRFFTKTKNSDPVYDPEFYKELSVFDGFYRFHIMAEKNLAPSLRTLCPGAVVQVFAELFANNFPNTIEYNEKFINGGSIVIFDLFLNGVRIDFPNMITILSDDIFMSSDWSICYKRIIQQDRIRFSSSDVFDELVLFYEENKEVLSSLKHSDRKKKKWASNKIQKMIDTIKSEFLSSFSHVSWSFLGADEAEGFVIRDFTSNLVVKLVDKENFSEQNRDNHFVGNRLKSIRRKFVTGIKKDVFQNADILKSKAKMFSLISENFFVNKQRDKTFSYGSVYETVLPLVNDMLEEKRIDSYSSSPKKLFFYLLTDYGNELYELKSEWKNKEKDGLSPMLVNMSNESIDIERSRIGEYITLCFSERDMMKFYQKVIADVILSRMDVEKLTLEYIS